MAAIAATLAATGLLVGAPPASAAPPGWIDTGYGNAGLAQITDVAPTAPARLAVDTQSRALLLTGGTSPVVTRLTAAGLPDPAFGTAGRAALSSTAAAAGWFGLAAGPGNTSIALGGSSGRLVLQKLLPAGRPDPGFGTAGVASVPVTAPPTLAAPAAVVAVADGGAYVWWQLAGTPTRSVIAKVTATGAADPALGAGTPTPGSVTLTGLAIRGLALDGSALVISATTSPGGASQLRRLTAAGTPDPTFNPATPGRLGLPVAVGTVGAVTLAPGGYLAGGYSPDARLTGLGHLAAVRVTAAGALDPAFGTGGVTVAQSWTCPGSTLPLATASAVHLVGTCPNAAMDVVKLSTAGAPDARFAAGGHATLSDLGDLFVQNPVGAGLTAGGLPLVASRGSLSAPPPAIGVVRLRAGSGVVPGGYVPLTPLRLLDNRTSPVPAGGSVTVKVDTGNPGSGIPAGQAAAVVLNVTASGPTTAGNLTVFPNGAAAPATSNVNFVAGRGVTNQVTVRVGAAGSVVVRNNSAGTVGLLVDVLGYYRAGAATAPGTFAGLTPRRILDTRNGVGAPAAAIPASGVLALTVAGAGGVPATGASAVVLNLTVTRPAVAGFVVAYPDGAAQPSTSAINFVAGQTIPNQVTVQLGPNGKVNLANRSAGTVHLIADVMGYYRAGTATAPGSFVPINPARMLDTRQGTAGPIGSGGSRFASLTAVPAVPGTGAAAAFNVTAAGPTATGTLTVLPGDQFVFATTNLSFVAGQTIANQAVSGTGYLGIWVINSGAGTVHAVVDVTGYFRS
jgi:uncharacterized delta-60 repeat protein